MGRYEFDTFTFDPARGELSELSRGAIALRHKVGLLLEYLVTHRERLVSKEELLEKLWQHGDYRENSLTQSIRELRKALGDSAQESRYVKTFPQRGYQWICPVAQSASTVKENVPAEEEAKQRSVPRAPLAALSVALLLAVLGVWKVGAGPAPETLRNGIPQLLVLPFGNDTGDPGRNWLELGLSDMLASSLQRAGTVSVTPPAISQSLLHAEGLEWPTLPANLRSLMRELGYDQALTASVQERGERYVLNFQLFFADGRSRRGSVTYTSLTANSDAIARQLMFLIRPQATSEPAIERTVPGADAVLASQARAQGLSALETSGAGRADDYFQAAMLLTPNDPWLRAYRGKTQLLLGEWQSAKQLLEANSDSIGGDPELSAFTRFWLAELAYRTGDDHRAQTLLDETIDLARLGHNLQVLTDAFLLRARLAWSNYQWSEHRELVAQAHELMPRRGDLQIEAEKLFYLGNPVSQGPEKDPQRDILASRDQLHKALNYYVQLGNQPMIAASQFALARNYKLDLDSRRDALKKAISLYENLRQPYELAEALIYAAFFQLQLHDGAAAQFYVERAEQVIEQLGNHRRKEELAFYRAFTLLDQGLDQSHSGRHGPNPELLRKAIEQFDSLIERAESDVTRAHALILSGWAHTDLQQYTKAQAVLKRGHRLSEAYELKASAGNAVQSLMHLHLLTGDYDKVLALAEAPVAGRLQLIYLARAHYELGHYRQAAETLSQIQQRFPEQWIERDHDRLRLYRRAVETGQTHISSAEVPAHSVYCESDWLLDETGTTPNHRKRYSG